MGKITLNVCINWKDAEGHACDSNFCRVYDTMPWPGVPPAGSMLRIWDADDESNILDTNGLRVDMIEFWPNGDMDIYVNDDGWTEDEVEEFARAAVKQGFTKEP